MKYIIKNWLILLFIISLIALITAFIAEYFYDLAPCKMCLKQRHTYYAIILLVIFFYLLGQSKNIILFILNELAIIYGFFYAIWHVGIEQKILLGPTSCSENLLNTDSIQNLKDQINNQPIINCSDISWTILGISAATMNSILLLLILLFNSIYIIKNFYGSEKIK
jgi:disulfide bond formation protein DsbB